MAAPYIPGLNAGVLRRILINKALKAQARPMRAILGHRVTDLYCGPDAVEGGHGILKIDPGGLLSGRYRALRLSRRIPGPNGMPL